MILKVIVVIILLALMRAFLGGLMQSVLGKIMIFAAFVTIISKMSSSVIPPMEVLSKLSFIVVIVSLIIIVFKKIFSEV